MSEWRTLESMFHWCHLPDGFKERGLTLDVLKDSVHFQDFLILKRDDVIRVKSDRMGYTYDVILNIILNDSEKINYSIYKVIETNNSVVYSEGRNEYFYKKDLYITSILAHKGTKWKRVTKDEMMAYL